MHFDIKPSDTLPIYRQIVEQVQRMIAGGACRPGDELPSVRALAQAHAINPMTVSKAYSLLEGEGLLERRRGVGMLVAAQVRPKRDRAQCLSLLKPATEAAAAQALQLGVDADAAVALLRQCFAEIQSRKPE
ncbi:GntR family transcriptional regulator [Roseateles albus]|uniref:GntR family transcriptional regulator n=1 Tax=Roseateles albus TaxID=2987525 RepID=A0ABT5KFV8_9BURK|nr:GntR family transcriptional regulator [Roseateles albus]MDC8772778.1 GntR family transcriptional regulator [Roseateles albus]